MTSYLKSGLRRLFCLLTPLLLYGSNATAQSLYEPFIGAPGDSLTAHGWTRYATVLPIMNFVSGSLSYPGSLGAGTGNRIRLTGAGQDVYRSFTATASPTYASFLMNVTSATVTGDIFMALGITTTQTARVFIKSSGGGFVMGIMRGVGGPVVYGTTVYPFSTTHFVVVKYTVVTGALNDVAAIYVNPPTIGTEPTTPEVSSSSGAGPDAAAALSSIQLFQNVAANAPTLELDAITIGNPWARVTTARYDYGDLPATFENNLSGIAAPALHIPTTTIFVGATGTDLELTPASVTAGAENNTTGDGADENGIITLPTLHAGGPIASIVIPVTAPAGTRYIYAWLDLNGDGRFQVGEEATTVDAFTATGVSQNVNLTWSAAQMATILPSRTKVYLRIRLSNTILNDYTASTVVDERSIGNGAVSTTDFHNAYLVAAGEVEDYQLDVVSDYDFGDAPATADQNKDGGSRPAYHGSVATLRLGAVYDSETVPASVAAGTENNTSGDGADEDAITVLPSVYRGASSLTIPVSVKAPAAATTIYAWLDLNNDQKFQLSEASAVTSFTGTGALQTVNLTWTAAQLSAASINAATTKMYLRIRLSSAVLYDYVGTGATLPAGLLIDERSIGLGVTAASVALAAPVYSTVVTNGEIEDYQLDVISGFDYGDLPLTFENDITTPTAVSRPAVHGYNPLLTMGLTFDGESAPASVTSPSDNNNPNGDGTDEDAVITLPTVRSGSASFVLPVSVRAPAATAEYIYGWLDLNGDGRFQLGEVATPATFTGTGGAQTVNLTWTAAQLSRINSTQTQIYARVRLSSTLLYDYVGTGASLTAGALIDERSIGMGVTAASVALAAPVYVGTTAPSFGEVEDYQLVVVPSFDYGDLPLSFENDATTPTAVSRPAVHTSIATLKLRTGYDGEAAPQSVNAGDSNNGTDGDGDDEDGIAVLPTIYSGGSGLTIPVSVTAPIAAGSKFIYAWLDLNGDGKFQLGEKTTTAEVFTNAATTATINLTWSNTQLATIPSATQKMYLRVRLSNIALNDYTGAANGAAIDERSIGLGVTTASIAAALPVYSTVYTNGEVEDYQLDVINGYDYGDLPLAAGAALPDYDEDNAHIARPAVHGYLATLRLGTTIDGETAPATIAAGADNNTPNGDGTDDDGITTLPTVFRGANSLTVPVKITAPAGTKYLYAWIDFDDNGKFTANEESGLVDTILVSGSITRNLTFTNAQLNTIPSGATKLYLRVRVSSTILTDATDATIDERSVGNGATSAASMVNNPVLALGEVEDYQLNVLSGFDYGDAPSTYEEDATNPNGVIREAVHAYNPAMILGTQFDGEASASSVAATTENNTAGDGMDEDAVLTLPTVFRGGSTLTVPVTVKAPAGAQKVYGWIDFNNDGHFQASEISADSVFTATGVSQTLNLRFTGTQLNAIPGGTANIYMRIRLTSAIMYDWIGGGANGLKLDERSILRGVTAASANTATAVFATTTTFGEVEDYQLTVVNGTDYGDAPVSFDKELDLTTDRPAISGSTPGLTLGSDFDGEPSPLSVTAGLDNNTTNGDGEDEDAIVDLPTVFAGGDGLTVPVSVTAPAGTKYIYAWLDLNSNGRFEIGEESTTADAFTAAGSSTINLSWSAAQLATVNVLTTQIYLRIRLSNVALIDFVGAGATLPSGLLVDERSIGRGATSTTVATNAATISYGEIEDYQLAVTSAFDYGDAPASYDMDNLSVNRPPVHSNKTGLSLGSKFDGELSSNPVTAPASNNLANGDGIDEDGVLIDEIILDSVASLTIDSVYRKGNKYSLEVDINAPTADAKFLYGWIDFNNNGRFEASEISRPIPTAFTTSGSFSRTLTWDSSQLATIPETATKLYARLRLSNNATVLIDATTTTDVDERALGNGATAVNNAVDAITKTSGEVEDYQLTVAKGTDYGDLPLTFETDVTTASTANASRPAVHGFMPELFIGELWDAEDINAYVGASADNNANIGDNDTLTGRVDEDGLTVLPSVYRNSFDFKVSVKVNNPTASTKTLYGWLDLNGDNRFQANEVASATLTAIGSSTQTLTWTAAQLDDIQPSVTQIYLRLRLSSRTLVDYITGTNAATIDERSIGNGARSATLPADSSVIAFGEVEDYRLNVLSGVDFGDVPASYEQTAVNAYNPARHLKKDGILLGTLFDGENDASSVTAGNDNNFTNGDGVDEDGLTALPLIIDSAAFSTNIQVTNTTGTKYLYAWMDINNDGRFQLSEAAVGTPISVTAAGVSSQTLSWTLASINSIPAAATNLYLRTRLSETALIDNTTSTVIDDRSVGYGATLATGTLAYVATTAAYYGEVEDYFLARSSGNDHGDAPLTFDRNYAGDTLTARNAPSSSIRLGGIPDPEDGSYAVPFTYSNNGAEGDGSDENGLTTPLPVITVGNAVTLPVRVTNTTGAAVNVIGWLDLNGDGIFQVSERSTIPSVATGSSNISVNLVWSAAQTAPVADDKLYLRIRISTNLNVTSSGATTTAPDRVAIGDGNNAETYGSQVYRGEVEDYQLKVNPAYDYGDAPYSYEYNEANLAFPARHKTVLTGTTALFLGHSTDIQTDNETGTQSVSNGNSSNGSNGDGADENGLTDAVLANQATIGSAYSVTVKVFRGTAAGAAVVHGWLDYNGDGRFTANEKNVNTATVTGTGNTSVTLNWTAISAADVTAYLRIRVTTAVLADGAGPQVDTRAVGYGNATGDYTGVAPNGEVEDYSIPTNFAPVPGNVDCDFPYGKIQSAFHASIALGPDGIYKAWGNNMGVGSSYGGNILSPVAMDKLMYPALTGNILKATIASYGGTSQIIVLSTDGLFAAGEEGRVLPNALTTSTTFQKIIKPTNGEATTRLPIGVEPEDVKHMLATPGALLLFTTPSHGGYIYVLGSIATLYGDRTSNTAANAVWHQVRDYTGTPLANITHVVAAMGTGFAADASNNLYTWGVNQYIGNGSALNVATAGLPANNGTGGGTNFWRARPMVKSAALAATTPKMLAITGLTASYFVLGNDGFVYSLGTGTSGILGVGTVTNSGSWQQVKRNATTVLSNVRAIAANDQDSIGLYAAGAVTATGECYTWGSAAGSMIGHSVDRAYATTPTGFTTGLDRANFIEVGGHTTVLVKDGSSKYCYVGHRIAGSMGDGTADNVFEPAFVCDRTGAAKVACSQLLDAGDAPAKFENGLGDNRAVHSFFYNPSPQLLYLGTVPGDDEYGKIYNVGDGDDNEGTNGDGDDEDGIVKSNYDGNGVYDLDVNVHNHSGSVATVYGWIDWNANGIFEQNELTTTTVPSNASAIQTATLHWAYAGNLICNTVSAVARSYIRVRITTRALTDVKASVFDERSLSAAKDGEMEDGYLDWETAQQRDYGNIQNTAAIFWPISYATIEGTGSRAWLGDAADEPTIECETDIDDASTSGLSISGSGVVGNGTYSTPYLLKIGGSYNFSIAVSNNAPSSTNVNWGMWFDVDGNGKFSESSDIFRSGSTPVLNGEVPNTFTVALPPTLTANVNAKIRIVASLNNVTFNKAMNGEVEAVNGEVEDYYITVQEANSIFVSGSVWDDADGNSTITPAEEYTNAGGTIYVNLVNASGNVEDSVAVGADGSYSLPVKPNSTGYKLVLTTSSTATTPLIPAGWINTGQEVANTNTATQTGTLGVIDLTTGVTNITGQNFGIEQLPVADPKVGPNVPNPGGTDKVTVPVLSGRDPEDGEYPTATFNSTYYIDSIPAPGTGVLYYNNVPVIAGQMIPNFNPSLLTFDPVDGTVPVRFYYHVVDFAGKPSEPALVTFSVNGYDFGDLEASLWPTVSAVMPTYKMTAGVPEAWDATAHPTVVVWAGTGVSVETETVNGGNSVATTDNMDDGISSLASNIAPGTPTIYSVTMNANKPGTNVHFRLWFDWNADGDFTNDNDFAGQPATYSGSGVSSSPVTVDVPVTPPSGALRGYVVRLIVTDDAGTVAGVVPDYYREQGSQAIVSLDNGEVEDYSAPVPLPVKMVRMKATAADCKVQLTFETAMEQDVDHFEIQHSLDATAWTTIANERAAGSRSGATYVYLHNNAAKGTNYYRILEVAKDGTKTFTSVTNVNNNCGSASTVKVYPNPAKNVVYLDGTIAGETYKLMDITGKLILSGVTSDKKTAITLTGLPNGTYTVELANGQSFKLQKQ